MSGFHFLSDKTLEGLGIPQADIADAIEDALLAKKRGEVWTAPKSALLPGDGRYMMTTLCASDDPQITGVKAVTVSPRNPGRGLDAINGAITLFDSETGLLKAVLEAGWVTAVRTAALSAVAARRLGNPQAETIAFVGTGVQARSHLDAFKEIFPLKRIRAFGRGQANIDKLCAYAQERGLEADAASTAQDALEGADIVVTSVTLDYSIEPFLDARWLKPGAFAAITDLGIPWLPETMKAFGQVFVDDREQEAASPKKMIEPSLIKGDLTEMVAGDVAAGFDPASPACFIFRGLAIGDFAVAAMAYGQAMKKGLGTRVED
ncbi:MAG: ornithine cyclodeaminase family protein [Tepidamorphaceae bacterium]|nr:ornithine cyclodeaminase family protein [Rhodobiaceae bacterium]MCC0049563.1 ornithine cyclodeaminase family protein [Rhodobiaceae bacterium]